MLEHRQTVVGLFGEPEQARDAITALKDTGYSASDISLLMPHGEADGSDMQAGSQAGAGSATGAIAGGLLGGVAGWMVGVGALAIPGVGPLIAAGALASALGGAALGAGAGAVAGALIGMGMSEEAADHYEREVRRGQTLVAVRTDERSGNEAEHVLRRFGATEVSLSSRSSALSDARGGPAEAQPLQRSAMDQRDVAHARFDRGSDGPTAAGPLHQTGQ